MRGSGIYHRITETMQTQRRRLLDRCLHFLQLSERRHAGCDYAPEQETWIEFPVNICYDT